MKSFLHNMWIRSMVVFMAATSLMKADAYVPNTCGDCSGNGQGFFAEVDLLVWRVNDPNVVLGTYLIGGTGVNVFSSRSEVRHLDSEWDAGVRVILGYDLPCSNVSFDLGWTHFNNRLAKNVFVPAGSTVDFAPAVTVLEPVPLITTLSTPIDATGSYKVDVDLLDVDAGYAFNCASRLMFEPFVGVRAAWINRTHRTSGFGAVLVGVPLAYTYNETLNVDFSGAGLRMGANFEYCLGWGFSVVGTGAGSVLWGTETVDVLGSRIQGTALLSTQLNFDYNQIRSITDLTVGVRWHRRYCDWYGLTFQAGWEQHQFLNLCDQENLTISETQSLCLNGFTFSVGFDY